MGVDGSGNEMMKNEGMNQQLAQSEQVFKSEQLRKVIGSISDADADPNADPKQI